MKQTIIHLSDLHYGKSNEENRRTRKIFSVISATYPSLPVVITGDLTDSATKSQLRGVRKEMDALAKTNPILCVPGNHDYAWEGLELRKDGWKNWVQYCGSPLGWGTEPVHWMGVYHEPLDIDGLGVWKSGDMVYIGVDSGDPTDKVISAQGYISDKMASSIEAVLKKYAGRVRIVMLHHHPFDDAHFVKLNGSQELMKALNGNCELLLFGHKHNYGLWWNKRGIPLTVSSHKTTNRLFDSFLTVTLIDIIKEKQQVSFKHRIEIIP